MNVGIVGHEAAKFTADQEARTKALIRVLLSSEDAVCVSGRCHLGGVDVWAEEIADELGREKKIYPPKTQGWTSGYKPRNILIAKNSDIVHCIVVTEYPKTYTGMRFDYCYHCDKDNHIKSGGCWTAKYALRLGKQVAWHYAVARKLK